MSLGRLPTSDSKIISTAEDLNRINESYREYAYQKVSTVEGNAQSWTASSNIAFQCPQYDGDFWGLKDFYLEAEVEFKVIFSTATNSYESALHAFSSCAPEEFFFSSLLESIEVTYGGVPINGVSAPSNLYPVAHSVYTLMTEDAGLHHGSAEITNFRRMANVNDGRTINQQKAYSIFSDSKNPYNMTLSYDKHGDNLQFSQWVFDYQNSTNNEINFNNRYTSTQKYLQTLIHNTANLVPATPAGVVIPSLVKPYSVNMVMKCKVPLFDQDHKLPANLPLRVTLRRSKDVHYSVTGDAVSDTYMAIGTDLGATYATVANALTSASYKINVKALDLYAKRYVLSDSQREVVQAVPNLQYDLFHWQAQQHNLTGKNFFQNLNFQSRPTLLMVGLVPKQSLNVPSYFDGKFNKSQSIFHTSDRAEIAFSRIYIETNRGKLPLSEYRPTLSNGDPDPAQSGRAYEQFKKANRNQMAVVPYQAWSSNYNWYTFIINADDRNPQYNASPVDRTTVAVTADVHVGRGLDEADVLPEHTIVVIAMTQNVLSVVNYSSVTVNV